MTDKADCPVIFIFIGVRGLRKSDVFDFCQALGISPELYSLFSALCSRLLPSSERCRNISVLTPSGPSAFPSFVS